MYFLVMKNISTAKWELAELRLFHWMVGDDLKEFALVTR